MDPNVQISGAGLVDACGPVDGVDAAAAAPMSRAMPQSRLVRARRRALVALGVLLVCGLAALVSTPGAHAAGRVYHVSPSGDDAGPGTAAQPFATVSRAALDARSGDTVLVRSGTYRETIKLDQRSSGVRFVGDGPTKPVIDGEGTRGYGFFSATDALSGVQIENFEIARQTLAGVFLYSTKSLIAHNEIHDVGRLGSLEAYGIKLVYGASQRVVGNTIRSIGPGGEAMGVQLVNTRGALVDGNTIYLVRKEGVRDYQGLDNAVTNNRIFLTWTAIAFNYSVGGRASNNYLHDNAQGINPKHTSDPGSLSYWKLPAGRWLALTHNTIYRSSAASIALAISGPKADYIDVRNNIFSGPGNAYIHDEPWLRGPNVIVDGNLYDSRPGRPKWLHHVGYDYAKNGQSNLSGLQTANGWEPRGMLADPLLNAPAAGDLDYGDGSPAAAGGIQLDGPLGTQIGARGLPPAPARWTPLPMKPISASSPTSWWTQTQLPATSDGKQATYWLSQTPANEHITYDLGSVQTIQHFVLDAFAHQDVRNVRGYRFEVSDDNRTFRTVLAGTNPDTWQSTYHYALDEGVRARYVRFTMVDTFCASYTPRTGCGPYFVVSDLRAGRLDAGSGPAPAPWPVPPLPAPTVPSKPAATPRAAAPAAAPPSTVGRPSAPSAPAATPRQAVSRVSTATARVRGPVTAHGTVGLSVRCPAGAARCRGAVTVSMAPQPSRSAPARRVGGATFRAGANAEARVRVVLSRTARRLLARRGTLRVRLTVRTAVGGRHRVGVRTVMLRSRR